MSSIRVVKKKLIISMTAIVLLIITLVGITYAYFSAKVIGNKNDESVSVGAGSLSLVYGDGNNTIIASGIEPNTTVKSKTFTVENNGDNRVENYDVILENVINELDDYEDLTYTLTCESTDEFDCTGSEGIFPKSQEVIATNSINPGVIHEYVLTLTYKETGNDQSHDMNKLIEAKVNIKDDVYNVRKMIVYGNSIQNGTPTLDNPIEINSLGNNTKNILDVKNMPVVHGNAYYPNYRWERTDTGFKGSYIKGDSSNSLRHGWVIGTTEDLKGKTIAVSFEEAILNENAKPVIAGIVTTKPGISNNNFDESMSFLVNGYIGDSKDFIGLGTNYSTTSSQKYTFTVPENVDSETYPYVAVIFYIGMGSNNPENSTFEYKNIQVEISDTVSSYEPYGYKIPIRISSKNLIDYRNFESRNQEKYPLTINKDGSLNYIGDYYIQIGSPRLKKGKEYTLNCDYKTESNITPKWRIMYSNDTYSDTVSIGQSITIDNGLVPTKVLLYLEVNNVIHNVTYSNIQLEEGGIATEFTPYSEVTKEIYLEEPLRKVGTYVDYIDFENKKVVRNTESVKLNISELNNTDNNPGWKNQTKFVGYFPKQNQSLDKITSILSNISKTGFGINTINNGVLTLESNHFAKTQTELKNNYNNLKVNLLYGIPKSKSTSIDIPDFNLNSNKTITVCDSNNVCASNIEIEYDE